MDQIHAFLSAYSPKPICLGCLAVVTSRSGPDVIQAVDALVEDQQAVTRMGECLNCSRKGLVVRLRAA